VRRLGIDDGDELDRYLIVAAAENNGRGIGESKLRRSGCDLLHRVRGSLPTHNLDVEILPGIVPFFERDKIIGVSSVVAKIGYEGDFISGSSVSLSQGVYADRC
jgi:hypothetical protein